jgi:hypothetical protein
MVKWRYSAGRDWLACEKCHTAIEADDRETLLARVLQKPLPATLSDRYAPRFLENARRLHDQFWEARSGPAQPA